MERIAVQVGRYQVLESIGTGAHSRVVRGYDPLIDRPVAIKLFSPELARGDARSRFLREARVVGKLSHPFIVTLHDMGIEESTSTPYLVMELVEGQPLDKLLSKGSVPFSTACAWVAEVAVALHRGRERVAGRRDLTYELNAVTADEGRESGRIDEGGDAQAADRIAAAPDAGRRGVTLVVGDGE